MSMPIQPVQLVHPTTGLAAVGVLPSGRVVWPVAGAAGDNDSGGDQSDTTDGDGGEDEEAERLLADAVDKDDQSDATGDDETDGEKDWQAEYTAQKKVNRDLERKTKKDLKRIEKLEAEVAELRGGKRAPRKGAKTKAADATADTSGGDGFTGDDTPDPDEVRREAEKAATEKANERIVRAEVRAAAAGKLADPADAVKFLELSQIEVGDDGEIDGDEIADLIDDLIKTKPYLAAQGGKRFKGSGDGGAKPTKPQRPRSLNEAVSKALAPEK